MLSKIAAAFVCTNRWSHLKLKWPAVVSLLLITSGCASVTQSTESPEKPGTSILVSSDMPYIIKGHKKFPDRTFEPLLYKQVFPQLIDRDKHSFLIHLGDLKAGSERCTDQLIAERMQLIQSIHPGRTIYTPGDNDWTDCDRDGTSYELERLDYVRKKMGSIFRLDKNFKTEIKLIHHPSAPENKIWVYQNIGFVTLNVPGTNMGRSQILVGDQQRVLEAADIRDSINEQWLEKAAAMFKQRKLHAMLIAFHANIFVAKKDGYRRIKKALNRLALEFRHPILLAHGDTSEYCLDQPLDHANVWRLNGPGDYHAADLTEITFYPAAKDKPFIARGLLVSNPVANICND